LATALRLILLTLAESFPPPWCAPERWEPPAGLRDREGNESAGWPGGRSAFGSRDAPTALAAPGELARGSRLTIRRASVHGFRSPIRPCSGGWRATGEARPERRGQCERDSSHDSLPGWQHGMAHRTGGRSSAGSSQRERRSCHGDRAYNVVVGRRVDDVLQATSMCPRRLRTCRTLAPLKVGVSGRLWGAREFDVRKLSTGLPCTQVRRCDLRGSSVNRLMP
jgi:hypothetical protein